MASRARVSNISAQRRNGNNAPPAVDAARATLLFISPDRARLFWVEWSSFEEWFHIALSLEKGPLAMRRFDLGFS